MLWWPSLGHFTAGLLLQEQEGRHFPHFPSWAIRTQRRAVAGFRPPRGTGWSQDQARTEPGAHAWPLGCLPLSEASLKHAPPLIPALSARGLRGRGGALRAPVTPSPRQRGHTGPNGPGAWAAAARPRGQSRRHGQPLRGGGGRLPGPGVPQQEGRLAASAARGRGPRVRAQSGGVAASSAPSRRERRPCRPLPRGMPDGSATFPGLPKLHFPGAIAGPAQRPPATPARGHRPAQASSPPAGDGAQGGGHGPGAGASSRPLKAQPPRRGRAGARRAGVVLGPVARPGPSTLPGKNVPPEGTQGAQTRSRESNRSVVLLGRGELRGCSRGCLKLTLCCIGRVFGVLKSWGGP